MDEETLGRAAVQYDDWRGTVALDDADDDTIRDIARHALGDRAGDYHLVGFDFYVGEPRSVADEPLYTELTLYLLPQGGQPTIPDTIADAVGRDGVLNVLRFSLEPSPEVDAFFRQVSKRFLMRLGFRAVHEQGAEFGVVGDLNELDDLKPDVFE